MSESLYLPAAEYSNSVHTDVIVRKLQRVCVLLETILQSDRSRYLEARTWLLNSIASQCPPANVRLACWEPLLAEALAAAPPGRGPSDLRYSDGEGTDGQRHQDNAGMRGSEGGGRSDGGEAGRRRAGRPRSPDGRDPHQGAGALAAEAAVASLPGPTELLTQLLMLVSEVWPDKVAALLLDRPQVFVDFFQGPGSSRRILMWFSHFSMDGMRAFKYGSHALAHFALAHRDEVWDLLRWEGKHAQAPVAVASKMHYFCELALVPSVRALLRHAPQFWASEQWRECCRDGAVLELDRRHFCEVLLDDLRRVGDHESRSGPPGRSAGARLAALLRDFLSAPSPAVATIAAAAATSAGVAPGAGQPHTHWQLLCQRLLHQLNERQLLRLVNTLTAGLGLQLPPTAAEAAAAAAAGGPEGLCGRRSARPALVHAYAGVCGEGGWQDLSGLALRGGAEWGSVGEAVLAHALAAARGPLQRMLGEDREELAGRLEEVEGLAGELHGSGVAGPAEGCASAAHSALLYGGRLEVAGPGRRCARDRLLLLAELWTLREAIRRVKRVPSCPGGAHAVSRSAAADRPRPASDAAAAEAAPAAPVARSPERAGGGAQGGAVGLSGDIGGGTDKSGDDVPQLALERVMAALSGVTFERLQGGGPGKDGCRGAGGWRGHVPFPGALQSAVDFGSGAGGSAAPLGAGDAAAGAATTLAAAGQYELLPSEDEEQGPGRSRRHRRRQERRDRSMGRSRGFTKDRHGDIEGLRGSRHGRKRKRRRRWRRRSPDGSESPRRSRSRSRSRSRGGGGSASEDEGVRGAREHRAKYGGRKRRREDTASANSSSSSSSGGSSSSAGANSGSESAMSSSSGEGAKAGSRERCGSSGLNRHVRRQDSSRRRRFRRGLLDSGRSSTVAGASGGGWYGARRTDSDEIDCMDPLAVLRGGRGAAAFEGRDRDSRDAVWRVRLPGSGGGSASGAPAGNGGAAAPMGGIADVEVVGGCDDVADLLAAAACKHWLALMLLRSGGAATRPGAAPPWT